MQSGMVTAGQSGSTGNGTVPASDGTVFTPDPAANRISGNWRSTPVRALGAAGAQSADILKLGAFVVSITAGFALGAAADLGGQPAVHERHVLEHRPVVGVDGPAASRSRATTTTAPGRLPNPWEAARCARASKVVSRLAPFGREPVAVA